MDIFEQVQYVRKEKKKKKVTPIAKKKPTEKLEGHRWKRMANFTKRKLRKFNYNNYRISKYAGDYLAGVLRFCIDDIFYGAKLISQSKDNIRGKQHKIITSQDIAEALKHANDEWSSIMQNVTISGYYLNTDYQTANQNFVERTKKQKQKTSK